MPRVFVVLCLLLLIGPSTWAQANKKGGKDNAKVQQATAQDYAFLLQAGQLMGTLHEVDTKSGVLTVRVEYQYPVLERNAKPAPQVRNNNRNNGNNRNNNNNNNNNRNNNRNAQQGNSLQQLMKQQQQLAKIDNPVERQRRWQQLMMQIQRAQAQEMQRDLMQMQQRLRQIQANAPDVKLETAVKEVALPASRTIHVRRWDLPIAYDNKGNVKEYTKEEMAELRGKNQNLPGYSAAFTDLHPGQVVRLSLTQPELASLGRPQVSLALIVVDALGQPDAKKKR